jgi:SNF family Na+-dependent transporter
MLESRGNSIGRYSFNSESDFLQPLAIETTNSTERGHYKYERPIEYWLVVVGLAIGYGSFWRFPYLVYSCGYIIISFRGGVFFIPFFLFLFAVGIPLFALEAILGQLFKKGPVEVFASIHKKYTGLGWATVIVSWFISLYYAIILAWSFYFFFASFASPLPWDNSEVAGEDALDKVMNAHYFKSNVLQISESIASMGSINGKLLFCLLVTYISIFLCIYKGLESSSKVAYITAPAPILLLVILLFK